jgi:alcohol dehydrogenase
VKAAVLHPGATALSVEEVPDPTPRPGAVVVRVRHVFVSPYMASLAEGSSGLATPPRPFIPGMDAVGVVEAVAEGVSGLRPGDCVYCDNFYASTHPAAEDDLGFIGNFAIGERAAAMLARWPNGALAEKLVLPADCVVPLALLWHINGLLTKAG